MYLYEQVKSLHLSALSPLNHQKRKGATRGRYTFRQLAYLIFRMPYLLAKASHYTVVAAAVAEQRSSSSSPSYSRAQDLQLPSF